MFDALENISEYEKENSAVVYNCLVRLQRYEISKKLFYHDSPDEMDGLNLSLKNKRGKAKSQMSEEESDSEDSSMELDDESGSNEEFNQVKSPKAFLTS